jgi:hypothetical protein
MYNDEDIISRIVISAIFLNIVAGQVESLAGKIESILTIACRKQFFVNTNIFHKCVSNQSAVLKTMSLTRKAFELTFIGTIGVFLQFVVKVLTNSATRYVLA